MIAYAQDKELVVIFDQPFRQRYDTKKFTHKAIQVRFITDSLGFG